MELLEELIGIRNELQSTKEELDQLVTLWVSTALNTSEPRAPLPSPSHLVKAARILRSLNHNNNPGNHELTLASQKFDSIQDKILTYELVFNLIRFGPLVSKALDSIDFFIKYRKYDHVVEEVIALTVQLLQRRFQGPPGTETPLPPPLDLIQDDILFHRVGILGFLARVCILNRVGSVPDLIPEVCRAQNKGANVPPGPLYAWINLKRISVESCKELLVELGLTPVETPEKIGPACFHVHSQFENLVQFQETSYPFLQRLEQDGLLVFQDKTSALAVYALVRALYFKDYLRKTFTGAYNARARALQQHQNNNQSTSLVCVPPLPRITSHNPDDWFEGILIPESSSSRPSSTGKESAKKFPESPTVVITNCGSGRCVAQLAMLLDVTVPRWLCKDNTVGSSRSSEDMASFIKNSFVKLPPLTILTFGVKEHRLNEMRQYFRKLELANIKVYSEDFVTLTSTDKRLKSTVAVLVNPECTGVGLPDPVKFTCIEGGDESTLKDMFVLMTKHTEKITDPSTPGPFSPRSIKFTNRAQLQALHHALRLPLSKLTMYMTSSILPSENEEVLKRALDLEGRISDDARTRAMATLNKSPKSSKQFQEVSYERIDLTQVLPETTPPCDPWISLIRRRTTSITLYKTEPIRPKTAPGTFSTNTPPPRSRMDALLRGRFTHNDLTVLIGARADPCSGSKSFALSKGSEGGGRRRSLNVDASFARIATPTEASLAKIRDRPRSRKSI